MKHLTFHITILYIVRSWYMIYSWFGIHLRESECELIAVEDEIGVIMMMPKG